MNRFPQIRVSSLGGKDAAARHEMVNRTQRVIRQRAVNLQARRDRTRSLWIPLLICSVLLASIFYAVWQLLLQYDLTPTGMPDSNYQLIFILLWSLPVSAAVLGLVWLKRSRNYEADEVPR
jgi:hypothetical protein